MYVDVYTTPEASKELSKILNNAAQQNVWDFEVKTHVVEKGLEDLEVPNEALKTGRLSFNTQGVFLGALSQQSALDFSWEKKLRKWQTEAKGHPLKKAIGGKREDWVIDATCGLGNDSSLLLAMGFRVKAFERHPLVFLALFLSQKKERFMLDRLDLNYGPLKENSDGVPIYFDPMFDDGKKRKAKPTKEMEVFHHVLGGDEDALEEAKRIKSLTKRFVVKRSPRDEPLLPNVNSQWESKALRLDLYL